MTADLDALEKYAQMDLKDVPTYKAVRIWAALPELIALARDGERWRKVESLMVHQHRGDAVGWTLDCLLPGDDPSAAIDSARGKK